MNNKVRTGLTVAVILLFIGLAVAPSINANVSKEGLVEFTTEVCGLKGEKQTVKLTQEEAEEVEALFDSIRERLNSTESRDEAEEIFKEAVVELDKYGLLGGLTVKQAQRLVTKGVRNRIGLNLIEKLSNGRKRVWENDSNNMCLVSGNTDITYFLGTVLPRVRFLSPIPIMNMMLFGTIRHDPVTEPTYHPSTGWIHTSGEKGIKDWNGTFWGNLSVYRFFDFYMDVHYALLYLMTLGLIFRHNLMLGTRYFGVTGFSGIKILNLMRENANYFYLGYALRVGLTYETPEYP